MLANLLNTPCQIVRRLPSAETDEYGNEIPGEELVSTTCSLQQRSRDEPGGAGELSITLWNLYLPTGTALSTGDAAVVGGHVYEVVGEPWDAREGSPAVWHVEATVRRTAGAEVGS